MQVALRQETWGSRERWMPSCSFSSSCLCLSSCWWLPILESGRMGPSFGVQGVGPPYFCDSDCGCWGGEGGQETKDFRPVSGQKGPAFHRPGCGRTGLKEQALLTHPSPKRCWSHGTLCQELSHLPTVGEHFPHIRLLGPGQDH